MSAQSPAIILSQKVKPASGDFTTGDLQQLVGRLLSILRYRRWLFVMPLLAGMTAALAVSLLVPRQYALRTVFERRDDPVLLKLVTNSPFNTEIERPSLRSNVIGHAAITEAFRQTGPSWAELPSQEAEDRERAMVRHLSHSLDVNIINSGPDHDLIELKYSGSQPELAEKVVPRLRDNYTKKMRAAARELQRQAQQFFSTQVEKRRDRAVRMQAELSEVLINQPEIDPRRPEWLHERLLAENLALEQLSRQKQDVLTEIRAREEYLAQLDEYQSNGAVSPPPVFATQRVDSPQRQAVLDEIAQIEHELTEARVVRRMKDTHPHVEALNRKLEQLTIQLHRIEGELTGTVVESDGNLSPLETERSRVKMELKTFRGRLEQVEVGLTSHQAAKDDLESRKATVLERQQQYMRREHELESARAELTVWQSRLEEINRVLAAEDVDRGVRFTTIEECHIPAKPSSPRLQATLLLSAAIGLALAVVAVFLRELFDRSLRSPDRVGQIIGIPVLETIGEILVRPSPKRWLAKYVLPATAIVQVGVVVGLGWLLYLSLERPRTYTRWVEPLGLAAVTEYLADASGPKGASLEVVQAWAE